MSEGAQRRVAVIATEEVPPRLRDLIPVAERWGIKSDPQRDGVLESAPTDELRDFVQGLEPRCQEIDAWLEALPGEVRQWPRAAVTFLWLRKTWHEAACELYARETPSGS